MKTLSESPIPSPVADPPRNRSILWLALAFLAMAGIVFFLVFRDQFQARIAVSTAAVLLIENTSTTAAADAGPDDTDRPSIAQASGWVEPDPFPILIPAKTEGFVESMHVLAGEFIDAGAPVANLDPADWQSRVAVSGHQVEEARLQVSVERTELQQAVAELPGLEAMASAREIAQKAVEQRQRRLQSLNKDDVSEMELIETDRQVATAKAAARESLATVESQKALQAKLEAQIAYQQAAVKRREAEKALADLHLSRTRILSPVSGIVLERFAEPGQHSSSLNGAALCSMYDPKTLQVRVDVPLANIGQVSTGQLARVSTAAVPGQTFNGQVTRIVGAADITRNTVQVKVKLLNPQALLRPEVLCRVEFLASPGKDAERGGRRTELWVPKTALIDASNGQASVWQVDPITRTVRLQAIELGSTEREGRVLLRSGLPAGSRVVLSPPPQLREGSRISEKEDRS